MFIILVILIIRRENIATPSVYIFVFANEVFDKNYTNISVKEYNKFMFDLLRSHISPWNIPSPLASKYFAGPSSM